MSRRVLKLGRRSRAPSRTELRLVHVVVAFQFRFT